MKRYILTLDLVDDPVMIAEYEAIHRKVWPEILKSITDAGILQMEIFRTANRLVMTMDVSDTFSFEEKAAMDATNPVVQEWEQQMWRYQQSIPGAKEGEKWVMMEKLFDLQKSVV